MNRRLEHLCQWFCKPGFGAQLGAGSVFPVVADRVFRGDRFGTRDRLASRGFSLAAGVHRLQRDGADAGSFHHFTDAAAVVETHKAVFRWFVRVLGEEGLLEGQTIAIDATTLEANAACVRSSSGTMDAVMRNI